jgi:hypothetical protein
VQKDGSLKRYLDYVEKIEIEDAFGFFQKSLVNASNHPPAEPGALSLVPLEAASGSLRGPDR